MHSHMERKLQLNTLINITRKCAYLVIYTTFIKEVLEVPDTLYQLTDVMLLHQRLSFVHYNVRPVSRTNIICSHHWTHLTSKHQWSRWEKQIITPQARIK